MLRDSDPNSLIEIDVKSTASSPLIVVYCRCGGQCNGVRDSVHRLHCNGMEHVYVIRSTFLQCCPQKVSPAPNCQKLC